MFKLIPPLCITLSVLLSACSDNQPHINVNTATPYKEGDNISAADYIKHNEVYNQESVIPPQCYTKTDAVNNPCYVCHQTYLGDEKRTNMMSDGSLQGEYQFSDLGIKNHWKNLFVDRSEKIKNISDKEISQWITQDNYSDFIAHQQKDEKWTGEHTPITNLAYPSKAFDEEGLALDNSYWVAYNYKPFPSTFWPTNGSTGDAMIRLPKEFREYKGEYSRDIYFANLALVEMTIKDLNTISLPEISEKVIQLDLNGDGILSNKITEIEKQKNYLGDAHNYELSHMLYPENTEFLHTVRYIGVNENNKIYNAPRMKEVRYMKKHSFKTKENLASLYYQEEKEKHFENLPQIRSLGEKGINTNFGWTVNGYIENEEGQLRPQNQQELAFCAGCHKTIGSTIDQTFSFARKVQGKAGWRYIDLTLQQDVPNIGEQKGEFLTYLQRVGGGDEFRQNQEMLDKWFTEKGQVNVDKVKSINNLYELITPSPSRALALNKAYFTIMKEQSYIFGRDATLTKAKNVIEQVDESQAPLSSENRFQWDIRLNWHLLDKTSKTTQIN